MTPINFDGADETTALDESGAADELLRQMTDAEEPSVKDEDKKKKTEEEAPSEDEETDETSEQEDAPEDEADDETEETDEEDEGEEPARKYADDDGVYTKIVVDGKEHEVPIKDLKRLYGQEAALTQRSQAVAEHRKKIDAEAAQYLALNQAMVERAKQRYAQYENVDFLALSRRNDISDEELSALRADAQAAHQELAFLTNEGQQFMTAIQQRQAEELRETAKAAIKELSDPEKGLPGWSEKLYDDIRAHAVSAGAPQEIVSKLVDPWAIRLIHDAMLYARGKSKIVTSKVSKVNKAPKRVVKTSTNPSATRKITKPNPDKKALDRLAQTGSTDDAAAAFLTMLGDQ